MKASKPGAYSVYAYRENSCGSVSSVARITVRAEDAPPPPGCAPNCPDNPIVVYPNPVDQVLTVEAVGVATSTNSSSSLVASTQPMARAARPSPENASHTDFAVKLLDNQQYVVRRGTSSGGRIQMDVSSLKPGVYLLHVIEAEGTSVQQIIVH